MPCVLFNELFKEEGCSTGDFVLEFEAENLKLCCHSELLKKIPWFEDAAPGGSRSVQFDHVLMIQVLKFIYVGDIEVNSENFAPLTRLCLHLVADDLLYSHCFEWLSANCSSELFYAAIWELLMTNETFEQMFPTDVQRNKLVAGFVRVLCRSRTLLLSVASSPLWSRLPVYFLTELFGSDSLPVVSEQEVLDLVFSWAASNSTDIRSLTELLPTVRLSDDSLVLKRVALERVDDQNPSLIELLLGHFLNSKVALDYSRINTGPRSMNYPLSPGFVITRQDSLSGNILSGALRVVNVSAKRISLSSKEVLHQAEGFRGSSPGVYNLSVTIECSSWSHRERMGRSLSSLREVPVVPSSPWKSVDAVFEDSYSIYPPTSDLTPPAHRSSVLTRQLAEWAQQDRIEHRVICGIRPSSSDSSDENEGSTKHAFKITQKERHAIYLLRDVAEVGEPVMLGGKHGSVAFTLQLTVGSPGPCGLCKLDLDTSLTLSLYFILYRCNLSILPTPTGSPLELSPLPPCPHPLISHTFSASSFVNHHFFITSQSFDTQSTYTVALKWDYKGGTG